MPTLRSLPLLLLLAGLAAGQHSETLDDHVRLSLVAEHGALVPGKTQQVGVRFQMEEGWHIYWRNPGDSGLPPEVKVTASEGVRVGEVLWPAPTRYVHGDGELVDFVYEGEVVLLVPVTVEAEASPGARRVQVSVRGSWLVCKEACVPESGTAKLELPVSSEPGEPTGMAAAFARSRARLPTPKPDTVRASWKGTELTLTVPGAKRLTAFPLLPEQVPPEDLPARGVAEGAALTLPYPERIRGKGRVRVLLQINEGEAARFHWVDLAAPKPTPAPDEGAQERR